MVKRARQRDRVRRRARFVRSKHGRIVGWPQDREPADDVAGEAAYVGSSEHKRDPSAGPPHLRHSATPCEPGLDFNQLTTALRESIRRGCVGAIFEGRFPQYVWGVIDGVVFEARHINGPQGTYKGYALEEQERPEDRLGLLV